jgi:membrane protease YdiL (CAAX protease family)
LPLSNRITALAVVIYAPLTVAALAWARFGQDRDAWTLEEPMVAWGFSARMALSLGLGAMLAALVIGTTPLLVERARWARALHEELRPIVDALSPGEITVLALSSGFAEELFFRGAMQPVVGLTLTSLVFGAVHTGPRRVFLAWSVWAFVMGLAFGLIFELSGLIWGPVLAHVLINQRNMSYMRRH